MAILTALHRILGTTAGPVTDDLIDEAVAAKIAETDDLDWKGQLPPTGGLAETDWPKDIAAMANHGGGTLVFGVAEKEKRATEREDVGELTERHEQALHMAAITAISPPVFRLNIQSVGQPGKRAVVVVIPPTTNGPHLIYKKDFFGAPMRNNADTVWMKESEIARMYRDRFDGERRAADALDGLYEETSANFPGGDRARIVAVARPRFPLSSLVKPDRREFGGLTLQARTLGGLLTNSTSASGEHPLDSLDHLNPRPGLRRWIGLNTSPNAEGRRKPQAALHHDGSVTLAAFVGGNRIGPSEDNLPHVVKGRDIEAAIADFVGLLLAVGEDTSLNEFDVVVNIEWGGDALLMQTFDTHGRLYTATDVGLEKFVPVVRTVRTDVSDGEFQQQAFDLAEDCVNQGGVGNLLLIVPAADWRNYRA